MREDLVSSAIEFLSDPQISSSPLTKKIEFLRSKGLTEEEIEASLKKQNSAEYSRKETSNDKGKESLVEEYSYAPPIPERDWKDYFIMATATISVGYGLYYLFNKVIVPSVLPQSFDRIENEKKEISREFDRVEAVLKMVETEKKEQAEKDQIVNEKLTEVIDKVDKLVLSQESTLDKNCDDLKLIKMEIDSLKNSQKSKDDQVARLVDSKLEHISSELTSLSRLMSTGSSSVPVSSPVPISSAVPSVKDILGENGELKKGKGKEKDIDRSGVPAWQLMDD